MNILHKYFIDWLTITLLYGECGKMNMHIEFDSWAAQFVGMKWKKEKQNQQLNVE